MIEIFKELKKAKKDNPRWPKHLTGQTGMVVQDAGALMQASITTKYRSRLAGKSKEELRADIRQKAVQTAVAAIRFLENFK